MNFSFRIALSLFLLIVFSRPAQANGNVVIRTRIVTPFVPTVQVAAFAPVVSYAVPQIAVQQQFSACSTAASSINALQAQLAAPCVNSLAVPQVAYAQQFAVAPVYSQLAIATPVYANAFAFNAVAVNNVHVRTRFVAGRSVGFRASIGVGGGGRFLGGRQVVRTRSVTRIR